MIIILGGLSILCLGIVLGMLVFALMVSERDGQFEEALDLCHDRIQQLEHRNPFEGPDGWFDLDPRYQKERDTSHPVQLDWHYSLKHYVENMTELVA